VGKQEAETQSPSVSDLKIVNHTQDVENVEKQGVKHNYRLINNALPLAVYCEL